MSSKNNKKTRRDAHQHALQREKQQLEALKKRQEKKQQKLAAKGVTKTHKRKSIRIKKGVTVKGIKITDSETKRKALKLIAKEAAMKKMDVDGADVPKRKQKSAIAVSKKPKAAAAAHADAMEM